jgi:Mor family transcriptional regulator
MDIKELLDDIKEEDIPVKGFGRFLAQNLGMEKFIELVSAAGGLTIYIPKADMLSQNARDRRIIKEFNGSNYKDLALKYNLSESWVRQVIQHDRDVKIQGKLFDEAAGQ